MRKLILCIVFLQSLLVLGCAVSDPALMTAMEPAAMEPDTFLGDSLSISLHWQRAQVWMTKHSATKIGVATDNLIQNEKRSADEGSRYNLNATKEPLGDGRYRISLDISGWCPTCTPKPAELKKLFCYYLRTGEDRLALVKVLIGIK